MLSKFILRTRESVVLQLSLSVFVCVIAPGLVIAALTSLDNDLTAWMPYPIATAFLLTCIQMVIEANLAVRRRIRDVPPAPTDNWNPTVTLLVVAYLPNEHEIVEQTIDHLCNEVDMPDGCLQVMLAYNTPEDMPIEDVLRARAASDPKFDVIRIADSTSKAENIMGALPHIRGEVVAILDTDHHLQHDSAQLALRWINAGYDVVQGRCLVRNTDRNLLTRMVGVEFETIYGIAHTGRSLLTDTAIFGGANGWWRTAVLRRLGVDGRMLTEDIDATLRGLLSGVRIIHERRVISTELAPTTFKAWWKQRTRWAQGWFQVSMRHSGDMYRSRVLQPWTKFYWLLLLVWREAFPIISLQIFSFLLGRALAGKSIGGFRDPYLITATTATVVVGAALALAAWRVAAPQSRRDLGRRWFFICALLVLPYTMLRNACAQAAMVREILGDRRWNVTTRDHSPTPSSGTGQLLNTP